MKGFVCSLCGGERWQHRACRDCRSEIPEGTDPRWAIWNAALHRSAHFFSLRKIAEIKAWRENQVRDEQPIDPNGCKRLLRAVIARAAMDRDEQFLVEVVGTTYARAREAIRRAQTIVVDT